MLLYQILDTDYVPPNPRVNMKIRTILGRSAASACLLVLPSCQLDLGSATKLQIQVKELLFAGAYRSKVVDDKISSVARLEVLNITYNHILLTANHLDRQQNTFRYFQPLAPQTLALTASDIHCPLSEYAGGPKATVIFSLDLYSVKFCSSPVINITPNTTALINHTVVGGIIPPTCCTYPLWHVLLNPYWRSSD